MSVLIFFALTPQRGQIDSFFFFFNEMQICDEVTQLNMNFICYSLFNFNEINQVIKKKC